MSKIEIIEYEEQDLDIIYYIYHNNGNAMYISYNVFSINDTEIISELEDKELWSFKSSIEYIMYTNNIKSIKIWHISNQLKIIITKHGPMIMFDIFRDNNKIKDIIHILSKKYTLKETKFLLKYENYSHCRISKYINSVYQKFSENKYMHTLNLHFTSNSHEELSYKNNFKNMCIYSFQDGNVYTWHKREFDIVCEILINKYYKHYDDKKINIMKSNITKLELENNKMKSDIIELKNEVCELKFIINSNSHIINPKNIKYDYDEMKNSKKVT